MSLARPFPAVLLLAGLLLLGLPPAAAEELAPSVASHGDLTLRILPPDGDGDGRWTVRLGEPFEVRYELENTGSEPLLLPLAREPFALGRVRYVDPHGLLLGGRGWGPPPYKSSLVELGPGEKRVETKTLTALMHGPAAVEVDLVSSHQGVLVHVPVTVDLGGGVRRTATKRETVPEPRLWHGHLRAEAPIVVSFTGSYGPGGPIDYRDVNALWNRDTPLLDRLETLGRLAELDATSRAVDTFRKGFGRRHDRPASTHLIRLECAKHLAIAVNRGYGFAGLKTLLQVAGDEDEVEDVRLLALEGLAPALGDHLTRTHGDCVFHLAIPKPWQDGATALLERLAAGEGALAKRAKALLDAP